MSQPAGDIRMQSAVGIEQGQGMATRYAASGLAELVALDVTGIDTQALQYQRGLLVQHLDDLTTAAAITYLPADQGPQILSQGCVDHAFHVSAKPRNLRGRAGPRGGTIPKARAIIDILHDIYETTMDKIRVLFVCMGNICRSPTAQGVFEKRVREAGLESRIEIDSAGTHAYHVGNPPDPRATDAAARRGIDLTPLRARQIHAGDFEDFHYVLAMDESNLEDLRAICPDYAESRLRLLLEFSSQGGGEVPDPYYGGAQGFERVLDLIEDAARGLLENIQRELQ